MKLMRSRFRLISLLLVCAFLLTVICCAASGLKRAGIDIRSLTNAQPSVSPAAETSSSPVPSGETPSDESPQAENNTDGATPNPESEYNVFGL